MSIPVAIEHAAGARIVVGDRVDVITVVDGVARFVATDLAVIAHADTETGGLSTRAYHLTVAVDDDQALALAEAIASAPWRSFAQQGRRRCQGLRDEHGT